MTTGEVASVTHGDVLEVRLDRPHRRNALSRTVLGELRAAFTALPSGTRAVVLSSTGDVFSAGADFADLTGTAADVDYDADLAAASAAIRTCGVPVVAAIGGPCIGAGVELALACDARIAGPGAWFRVPAVELGLLYNPRSIQTLHAMLPRATLTRLLVFAERFDADDAARGGLATHTTTDDPRPAALTLAGALAAKPAEALAATRALLAALDQGAYSDSDWQSTRIRLLDSPDRFRAVNDAAHRHGVTGR
ncbi:enoyl-CoA hydratase/isomerase family protein [Mycolicibacterium litorale]|uniref:enoyl-CoA hydratase/isomerase family protein n=1 Tax=Mycolicibacterium litorale TaxID=758802 RepID=UPI003CE8357C